MPETAAFAGWYKRTAPAFHFVIKGSRFITHIKRLRDCREPLRVYFSRAKHLREKLGLVLWQLPPHMKKDLPRLVDFIAELKPYRYRHCFEFRHETWFDREVYAALSKVNACLCMADPTVAKSAIPETADFIYLRRHGVRGKGYSGAFLRKDAKNIRRWVGQGKDVYIYFNNDALGFAIRNAFTLKKLLGLPKFVDHAAAVPG